MRGDAVATRHPRAPPPLPQNLVEKRRALSQIEEVIAHKMAAARAAQAAPQQAAAARRGKAG